MQNEPVGVDSSKKEGRFSQIFQLLPDAVLVARANDSVVLDVNQAFETLTGYGPDTIVGRPALSLVFFLDPDLWMQVRREICAKGVILNLKTSLLRKDGQIAFVHMSMRSVEIDGISCHLATIHDLSEHGIPEKEAQVSRSAASSGLENLLLPDAAFDREEVGRLIDFQSLQDLMNSFYKITRIGIGINDIKGNVQVATGWQDICTRFHRIHPETLKNCLESDIYLSQEMGQGGGLYTCKNGMWDMTTPLIIGGRHIANIFLGQFFFEDEVPDYEFFRKQAEAYGFDVEEYLAALDRVPRWSRELVQNVMEFYKKLAMMISRLSIGTIRMSRMLVEQKMVEEELRQSEERYRRLMEMLPIATYTTDAEGRITFFNRSAATLWGREPKLNEDYWCGSLRLWNPDGSSLAFDECPMALMLKEKMPNQGMEIIIERPDASRVYVLPYPELIYDSTGQIVGGVNMLFDITDRKEAEEQLLLSKFCLDNAGIGIYHTFEQRIFNVNDHACRSLGYSVAELCAMRITDIDPAITEEKIHEITGSLETTGSATYQTVYRRKDGTTFPVEITATSVEFQGRRYTISFVQDIAERKRAEEALRESEEKFRVLAETSPTSIVLYQGPKVVYINPKAARMIGYSVEELSQMSFWGCVHEDFKDMVRERGLARLRGEEVPSQYECKFITKDGKELWALLSVGRIEYKGKPASIVTLVGTTEAKLAEERLRASLAEKEILLKEVHHRVKNNLQIVSSLLDLQSDSIGDGRFRGFITESQNRIMAMALIHERLYRSENFSFINIGEYIKNLAGTLFSTYGADPHLVTLQVDVGDICLEIDEAIPCGLIVNELVSNSLKHAFPDGQQGEITIKIRAGEDGMVILKVADNGVGISKELDSANTETLGLQLVAMLTQQLRGRVELARGHGTSWEIAFHTMAGAEKGSV